MTVKFLGPITAADGTALATGASVGGTAPDLVSKSGAGNLTVSSAQSIHAGKSVRLVSTASADTAIVRFTGFTTKLAAHVYIRMDATPATAQGVLQIRNSSDVSVCTVTWTTANQLTVEQRAFGLKYTTTAALALNTWHRISLYAQVNATTSTAGTLKFRTYAGDSTTATNTYDSGATFDLAALALDRVQIGKSSSGGPINAYISSFRVDDTVTDLLPPEVAPSFSTLTDTYTTLDGTKWVYAGNASIVSGRLQLTTSATYQGAKSLNTKNLDVPVPVQVVQTAGPGNNTVDTTFQLSTDASNNMSFTREGTLLYAQRMVAGVTTTIAQPAYNATSHAWWRFAVSGGQVLWQVSPDGTTWTTLGTPWTPTFPITNLYAELTTGYYGTEPSPGVALFDNFGLPPASNVSPTANAGVDQTNVEPWSTVTLSGTDSDSDGTIASRTWTQTGGSPTVTLSGSGATRTFAAPGTIAGTTLTFQYAATDNAGATTTDTMTVAVLPAAAWIMIGGSWVPCRWRTT